MPLSADPRKRERQLANLRRAPNPPAPPLGNRRTVTHGGYAEVSKGRLTAKVAEIAEALAEDAPLRGPDARLPRADTVAVTMLAKAICRLEDVEHDLEQHGWKNRETGEARPAVEREGQLRREIADWLDALGMTPRSRARLGLDLQRTVDMATAMSEEDPRRRAAMLEELGVA